MGGLALSSWQVGRVATVIGGVPTGRATAMLGSLRETVEDEGREKRWVSFSLIADSQGLLVSQQYFSLIINQHQSSLSTQKPTSEQAD